MRRYDLYIIDDEVARDFFGKEPKLNQLFHAAFYEKQPEHRLQLERQVNYITKTIPMFRLKTLLQRTLKDVTDYTVEANDWELTLRSKDCKRVMRLQLDQKKCVLWSSGDLLTETLIFDRLREIDPYFLAVDRANERCGWLQPIKLVHRMEGSS
ncbi:MAG TPA: sporulation inhibitor of replication protein SirA [Sporolactobacillaceae bacterium]|nr:sporulation inhibitor of replication protein SirA [Sporolactobacillaceae bacterium]